MYHQAGSSDPYAAFRSASDAKPRYGSMAQSLLPQSNCERKRINILPICVAIFLPWLTFCLVCAMLSFEMHYKKADTCRTLSIIMSIVFGVGIVLDCLWIWYKRRAGVTGVGSGSWIMFICVSCLLATLSGLVVGNYNFLQHSEIFYDVMALNSYDAIDPSKVQGQEFMDAGRMNFVNGTRVDLARAMSFRNMETYCVAPISNAAADSNATLGNYDFWAVGKDCCSLTLGDVAFQCGPVNNQKARGGIRLMRNEERAFYRLAVQQAESSYQIKATHPLFFHWVEDPVDQTYQYQREAFQNYFAAMSGYYIVQMLLTYGATVAFKAMS